MRFLFHILLLILVTANLYAEVQVKVKNLCSIDGYKYNQVYGYGLVVGLSGTGDSKTSLTRDSIKNLLSSLGIQSEQPVIKNIAAVLVSARLNPHTRVGDKVDVTVSSIGDAKSLEGGLLIQSPLKGANGKTYVVAQGKLEAPIGDSNRRNRKGATVVRVSNGGIVESEIQPRFIFEDKNKKRFLRLNLRRWDHGNADKIAKSINKKLNNPGAAVGNNGKILVPITGGMPLSEFIGKIMDIEITPELKAKIVIDQRNGVIVSGGNITVSESLVSRKGMTIEIEGTGKKNHAALIKDSTTVKDIVDTLNAIGAKTDDIIAILKALKDSGSLHADMVLR